jgi:hypothetical protein
MHIKFFVFLLSMQPNAGQSLLILEVSRSHTTTHYSRQDSSGRVISSSQRLLPDNTQHSQQTSMPSAWFEPTIPAKRAAADLSFRPRGHWDRHALRVCHTISSFLLLPLLSYYYSYYYYYYYYYYWPCIMVAVTCTSLFTEYQGLNW